MHAIYDERHSGRTDYCGCVKRLRTGRSRNTTELPRTERCDDGEQRGESWSAEIDERYPDGCGDYREENASGKFRHDVRQTSMISASFALSSDSSCVMCSS